LPSTNALAYFASTSATERKRKFCNVDNRSPDSKYVVFGGEDDLVNVYSLDEKRVVVRGQGHKSWVSVVQFDNFNISYGELPDGLDFSGKIAF
jgi:WD40 repeat protein